MIPNAKFQDSENGIESPCFLAVDKQSLLIYFPEPEKNLVIWQIKKLKSCEYLGTNLKLVNGKQHSQSILCDHDISKQIMQAWLADELPPEKNSNPLFVIRLSLFIVVFVVLSVLGFYYFLLPYAAEKAVKLIPVSTEIQIGETMGEKIKESYPKNDSADYYANKIISALNFNSAYKINVTIIPSQELNAFAIPGGQIFVHSAMLKQIQTIDQWVALIGHEQTHINNRHSLKSLCRQAAGTLLVASLFGDIGGLSTTIIAQVQSLQQLDYSRELETEADDEGLRFMQKNGFNGEGMLQLLQMLNKETMATPAMMKYLSTHPDTESRILNVKSQLIGQEQTRPHPALETLFQSMKKFVR